MTEENGKKDLSIDFEDGTFHYRVGAIIVHDGKLLTVRDTVSGDAYSIGGRVHYKETADKAVLREVEEETGIRLEIDRPAVFFEASFYEEWRGSHFHEVCLYFLMKDSKALDNIQTGQRLDGTSDTEYLEWIALEKLKDENVSYIYKIVESILPESGIVYIKEER